MPTKPARRNPPPTLRRNTLGVQLRKGHPQLRRTKAFVQEWNDLDMDRVFADMGARVDVSVGSGDAHDAVSLDSLEALTYRKGAGSRALRALLDLTDKHGLTVTLTAEPFSVRAFPDPDLISRDGLVRFYKRFGFGFDGDEDEDADDGFYPMIRYPRAPNPAKTPKAPRTFRDLGAWTDWARTQGMTLRLSRAGYGPVEVTDLYADVVGTGAGSRVMEALVAAADQQGMPLRLTPSGKRNITFYERFGFTVGRTAYDTAMHRTPRQR